MKKSIKVKGAIKIDKNDLINIRGGSCAYQGIVCESDIIIIEEPEMMEAEAVDRLYI